MYKKQLRLFKRSYMINDNENKTENEKRSQRYDMNRLKSRHKHKCTK